MPVVESAIREWRHNQTRRPLPADIRRLCIEELSQQQFEALPRPTLTESEIEFNARLMANKWAQEQGFDSIDDWQKHPSGQDLAVKVAPGVIKYFRKQHHSDDAAVGRNLINQWAQQHGYDDVDAMAAAQNRHWSELYRDHIRVVLARSHIARTPPPQYDLNNLHRELGLTAKPEFNPSADQMSRSRNQLGIPEPQPPAAPAAVYEP